MYYHIVYDNFSSFMINLVKNYFNWTNLRMIFSIKSMSFVRHLYLNIKYMCICSDFYVRQIKILLKFTFTLFTLNIYILMLHVLNEIV